MSAEDRYTRLHPQPEKPTEPLTNKQLTDAKEDHDTKLEALDALTRGQKIGLIVAFVFAALLAIYPYYKLATNHPAPQPVTPTTPAAVMARIDSLEHVITVKTDSMAVMYRLVERAESAAVESKTMAEAYGQRVDELWTGSRRYDFHHPDSTGTK